MLRNDPPAGTKITFLRSLQKVEAYERATLIRPVAKYYIDRPEDLFEVEYRGERMIVERRDIQEASQTNP